MNFTSAVFGYMKKINKQTEKSKINNKIRNQKNVYVKKG